MPENTLKCYCVKGTITQEFCADLEILVVATSQEDAQNQAKYLLEDEFDNVKDSLDADLDSFVDEVELATEIPEDWSRKSEVYMTDKAEKISQNRIYVAEDALLLNQDLIENYTTPCPGQLSLPGIK